MSCEYVCPSVCPSRRPVHSEVKVSVEYHIMRLIAIYSVIVGLNLLCGVKKNGVVGLKKDQRKIKGIT